MLRKQDAHWQHHSPEEQLESIQIKTNVHKAVIEPLDLLKGKYPFSPFKKLECYTP